MIHGSVHHQNNYNKNPLKTKYENNTPPPPKKKIPNKNRFNQRCRGKKSLFSRSYHSQTKFLGGKIRCLIPSTRQAVSGIGTILCIWQAFWDSFSIFTFDLHLNIVYKNEGSFGGNTQDINSKTVQTEALICAYWDLTYITRWNLDCFQVERYIAAIINILPAKERQQII